MQDSQGEVLLDKFHNVYSQISSGPNVGPAPGAASKLNGAGRGHIFWVIIWGPMGPRISRPESTFPDHIFFKQNDREIQYNI